MALLMPISQVGHMYRDGRAEANLSRRIRSLARAHAVNPVAHVALAWGVPRKIYPIWLIGFFGKVANVLPETWNGR
ncbi:MAG: hypothetical protein DMG96_20620 [Acidobacteria bacterium]|nr:MAG: hypothetical protein DMG96_20620 [Acidobacteriota bacterium]